MGTSTNESVDSAESEVESCTKASPPTEPRAQSGLRRALGRIIALVSTIAVAAILALAVFLTLVPAVSGGHTLTVLSGSMVPRLPVGSVVVDRPVAPGSLDVGDIVTYQKTDQSTHAQVLITHRIVAKHNGKHGLVFTTKGDANRTADPEPVRASQIRGELWYDVPYIGIVRGFLLAPAGLLMIGSAVLLIAAIWFLARVSRSTRTAGGGSKP
ncbi:signal peptidase I [Spelaeicoccus albus]|uniref:Signal peptidase I n=1 Tax=Spelaeicoccus albus TaxID=1280376 RepID=A0A7Z0D5F2_9MICO|nr:signal peptidase I [Spelaeicoccus albus]NYI69173.1 signal peptidase [Spelaeicoccus albus]